MSDENTMAEPQQVEKPTPKEPEDASAPPASGEESPVEGDVSKEDNKPKRAGGRKERQKNANTPEAQAERREAFKRRYTEKFKEVPAAPTEVWEVIQPEPAATSSMEESKEGEQVKEEKEGEEKTEGGEEKTEGGEEKKEAPLRPFYACHITGYLFTTARQCQIHMKDEEYTQALEKSGLSVPDSFQETLNTRLEEEDKRRTERQEKEKARAEKRRAESSRNRENKESKQKKKAEEGGTKDKAKTVNDQKLNQLTKQVESRDRRNAELTALLDRKREDNFVLKQEKHALILENQQLRKSLNSLLKQLKDN